jgi:hypothetical protein
MQFFLAVFDELYDIFISVVEPRNVYAAPAPTHNVMQA